MSQRRGASLEIKVGSRNLTVAVSGAENGRPVFLLHGMPGSRTGPKPRSAALHQLDVMLISYDRPGYGGSTRQPQRTVADAAADVRAIADELGIDRFAVVGRSGGGPHALACAALLGQRVSRAAVLVSPAPSNAPGLDWYGGMTTGNVDDYSIAATDAAALMERLRLRANRAVSDPTSLLDLLREQMTAADKRVVGDVVIQRQLTDAYFEALKDGPFGWIDDVFALSGNWDFDLSAIDRPVRIWHGVDDNFSPVGHARWLASRIRTAELRLQASTAHFGAVEVLPEMLIWLAEGLDGQRPHSTAPQTLPPTEMPATLPTEPQEKAPAGTKRTRPAKVETLIPIDGTYLSERVWIDDAVQEPAFAER